MPWVRLPFASGAGSLGGWKLGGLVLSEVDFPELAEEGCYQLQGYHVHCSQEPWPALLAEELVA